MTLIKEWNAGRAVSPRFVSGQPFHVVFVVPARHKPWQMSMAAEIYRQDANSYG